MTSPEVKAAQDKVRSIKRVEELNALIDSLNITDDEREVARLVLSNGWSYTRVSIELGYSDRQVRRIMNKIYRKITP